MIHFKCNGCEEVFTEDDVRTVRETDEPDHTVCPWCGWHDYDEYEEGELLLCDCCDTLFPEDVVHTMAGGILVCDNCAEDI